jgi:hypothetical protein
LKHPPAGPRASLALLETHAVKVAGVAASSTNAEMLRLLQSECEAHRKELQRFSPWLAIPMPESRVLREKLAPLEKPLSLAEVKLLEETLLPIIEEELRGDLADESRAIRENQAFMNDTYKLSREKGGVFVYLHDNPSVHWPYHTNLAKSEEAMRWPEQKWMDFQQHIMEHLQVASMMQQMGGGQPAGPGTEMPSPEMGPPQAAPGAPGAPPVPGPVTG